MNQPPHTEEERKALSLIGKMANVARKRKKERESPLPVKPKSSSASAGSIMTLADYDNQIGLPVSWGDAIKREQLMGEKIANETKQIEMDKIKGKLLTAQQVSERDDAWNKAVADEAEKVQRLIDSIEGVTPEQRKAYLERFREWRKDLGKALSSCR